MLSRALPASLSPTLARSLALRLNETQRSSFKLVHQRPLISHSGWFSPLQLFILSSPRPPSAEVRLLRPLFFTLAVLPAAILSVLLRPRRHFLFPRLETSLGHGEMAAGRLTSCQQVASHQAALLYSRNVSKQHLFTFSK